MDLRKSGRNVVVNGLYFGLFITFVLHPTPASCISVTATAEVNAVRGETVTLSCSFTSTSRLTSKMSVDWSYRPPDGGPPHTFFHFFSVPYPPEVGQFKGRVKWSGNPARNDASIQLLNATLTDNGTYSCAVRNPPDVHGPPADTILTISPKKAGLRFSDVAVLALFVLFPSALITLVLLMRICCPCCSPAFKTLHLDHHSPIEVADGGECGCKRSEKHRSGCCELVFVDSDGEDYSSYYEKQQLYKEAESKC
ncbi:myelin protein zero-like protein 3 [Trichomycterus rosablanca]|uniref:myelin protein zero-like protein 3 n=1 Tax=Trichomycterus rosablanca TaxID=2290929 RepID=UPI002F35AC01